MTEFLVSNGDSRANIFKMIMRIVPGDEGSFVVEASYSGQDAGAMGFRYGFTTVDDLLSFLGKRAEKLKQAKATDV